ncbi:MAG: hypothetical protein FWD19_03065 [Defluviitaleaceae bacterium]|nr:hypothetical protein [Defluviitaleaceae bacterium]
MLRPIDMTLTIQNSGEAHRAGLNGAQTRPEITAQMFADRLEKQVRQQEQQVIKSPETEDVDVNPDRQGHGGGYKPKHQRTKTEEKPKPKSKSTGESLYDITI